MRLLTADLHFSANKRDAYRFKFIDWLIETVEKFKVSEVDILGDLTEEKDNHSAWLTNRVVGDLYDLAQKCPIVIARGNHDGTDPTNPFFEFSKHISGITWISKPTKIKNTLYLPHTRDHKKDWAKLEFDGVDIILTHNTFEGAVSEGGQALKGIPLSALPKMHRDEIYSGDVHVPQVIGPVTYVGAPYTIKFGDSYEPRVLLINGGRRSLPVPGPRKFLLECLAGEFPKLKNKVQWEDLEKGDILKIRITIQQKDVARWNELRRKMYDWGAKYGVVIHSVIPVLQVEQTRHSKTAIREAKQDDHALLDEFGRRHAVDAETLKVGHRIAT